MTALLNVSDLTYSYGNRLALDRVAFVVPKGRTVGLLGPNGAGKTTTIHCIVGLKGNWQGTLEFAGARFAPAQETSARRRLGYVPQELALYDGLTAYENLRLFAKLAAVEKSKLHDAIEHGLWLAGLTERAKDLVKTFSGGMKRRLNLAIGQIHQPELLLLDEPTVGVDPQSRNHLFDSLDRLKQSGMTLLYTTHYMEEAERLCDSIVVMNDGRVIANGTKNELATMIGDPQASLESIFLKLTGRGLRDE